MKKSEIEKDFETIRTEINNNLNLALYRNALQDMRILLEKICNIYIEKNNIKIDINNEDNGILARINCIENNNLLNRNSIDNFHTIRKIGNIASHEIHTSITKENAEELWNKLQIEMKVLLDSFPEDKKPININSLLSEGWTVNNYESAVSFEKLDSAIVETIDNTNELNVYGTPSFISDFCISSKLPCLTMCLEKRTTFQDRIEYEGFIPFDCRGINYLYHYLNFSLTIEKESKRIILFSVFYEEHLKNVSNNNDTSDDEFSIFYLYRFDEIHRIREGYWFEKNDYILNKLKYLKILRINEDLSTLSNSIDSLSILMPETYYVPFTPIRFVECWFAVDDNGNTAYASGATVNFGDNLDIIYDNINKQQYDKIFSDIKYSFKIDIYKPNNKSECDEKKLKDVLLDLYRLNYITNGLYTYFEKYDYINDIMALQLIYYPDKLCRDIFGDFRLSVERIDNKCVFELIDDRTQKTHLFPLLDSNLKTNYDGLVFPFDDINIDYYTLLDLLIRGDTSIPHNKLSEYTEEKFVNALKKSIKYSPFCKKGLEHIIKEKSNKESEAQKKALELKKVEEYQRIQSEKEKKQERMEKEKKENARKVVIILSVILTSVFLVVVVPFVLSLIIVLVAAIINSFPASIDLNDYYTASVSGYNQIGSVDLIFDWDKFEKDYGEKIRYINNYNSKDENKKPYETLVDCFDYNIEDNGSFSNGDTAIVSWDIDEDTISKAFNCKIKYKDFKVKISGLEDVEFFDAFYNFDYNISGVSTTAELQIISNLNSMGYYGLYYESDKTQNIKNGDIINISIYTENGEDILEYCIGRFDKVPNRLSYSFVAEGLPEYINKYEQISSEALANIIENGESYLRLEYKDNDYIKNMSYAYMGNYFLYQKNNDADYTNKLILLYKVNTNGKYSDYCFYESYEAIDIYLSEDELSYRFYDCPNKIEYKGMFSDKYYGTEYENDLYNTYISPYSETYYIQNNMNE